MRRLSALPKRNLIDDEEEFEHVQVQRAHRNDNVENLSVNRFPSETLQTDISQKKRARKQENKKTKEIIRCHLVSRQMLFENDLVLDMKLFNEKKNRMTDSFVRNCN